MINNSYIKKKYTTNMIFVIIGMICLLGAVVMFQKSSEMDKESFAQSIYFGDAYVNEMVTPENIKENPFVAHVDIKDEPIEFAYYSDSERYAFIVDEDDIFLMSGSLSKITEINNSIKADGQARVMGQVKELDPEVMDMAFETYLEFGLDNPMTREEFDDYFKGAAIYQGYAAGGGAGIWFLGVFLGVVAIMTLLIGVPGFISFVKGMRKLSETEKDIIAAELEDPRTIYLKSGKVFITPNYLVYADKLFAVIPFADITWVYKYMYRLNFIPVFSCINVYTKDHEKKMVSLFSCTDNAVKEVCSYIYTKNPEVRFGFSKELQNYFGGLKYRAKHSA